MIKPKVVLFDLGKVLVHFDWRIAARNISPHCKYSPEELLERMMKSPLLPQYELGRVSSIEFFEQIKRGISYTGSFEEFAGEFGRIFSPIPEMIALHARVRAAGFPTWIFSNTNDLAIRSIRRDFPFFSGFDGFFLSYELGVMKPAAAIYEIAEQRTGQAGPEILYVDDFAENVGAGAARGWQAILHSSSDQTTSLVERSLSLRR